MCIRDRYKTGEPVYLRGVIFGRLLKLLLRVLAHGKPQLLADRGSKMVKTPEPVSYTHLARAIVKPPLE